MDVDTAAAARGLLPVWVPWGSLLAVVGVSLLLSTACGFVGALVALRPLRANRSLHWAERARLAYAARVAVTANGLILSIACGALALLFDGPFSAVSGSTLVSAGFWVALATALCVNRQVGQRLRETKLPLGYALRSGITLALIFLARTLIFLIALGFVGDQLDATTFAVVALAAGTVAVFTFGGGLSIARGLRLARPAGPRLATIVATASARVGTTPRATYELTWAMANAVAFPLQQCIAVSDRALATVSDDELTAICAHELGHLNEPGSIVAVRVATCFLLLPLLLLWPIATRCGWLGAAGLGSAILLAFHAFARLSRRLEARADRIAQAHEGEDAGTYARALETIHCVNLLPAVLGRGAGHPDLYDRMIAAGVQPDYPRPARPSRRSAPLVCAMLVAAVGIAGGATLLSRQPALQPVSLLLHDQAGPAASALAWQHWAQGDTAAAVTLLRAVAQGAETSWSASAHLAVILARARQCDQAQQALDEAQARRIRRSNYNNHRPDLLGRAMWEVRRCAKRARQS